MKHFEQHPLAGKEAKLKAEANELGGQTIKIEDYWDRVSGQSWMFAQGNPACLKYALRSAFSTPSLPNDDEVVYGKIDGLGHLVHVNELQVN